VEYQRQLRQSSTLCAPGLHDQAHAADVCGRDYLSYSFAVPDDTSDSAWLVTEYIPPESSQTKNGALNWGHAFEVPLG
jgi:hypothetical protein